MKYHLFAANAYDDEIGLFSYRGAFDTAEEARAKFTEGKWNTGHIAVVDQDTLALKMHSEWRYAQPGDPEYVPQKWENGWLRPDKRYNS